MGGKLQIMYCLLMVEIQLMARQIGVKMTEMLLKVSEMIDLGNDRILRYSELYTCSESCVYGETQFLQSSVSYISLSLNGLSEWGPNHSAELLQCCVPDTLIKACISPSSISDHHIAMCMVAAIFFFALRL